MAIAMAPGTQAHDALFKAVFSSTEDARGLLASVLPEEVVAAVDWSTLTLEPGSYIDAALRQSHSDLLFRVQAKGDRPLLLYVLVEHQSKPDAWMPQRLHEYIGRIWARWRTEHPGPVVLPPVLPIVVHHGAGGWRHAVSLAELYALDAAQQAAFAVHLPALRFVLYDLGIEPEEAVARRGLTALGKLALLCLKLARRSPNILVDLTPWLYLFAGVLAAPDGVRALARVLIYILQATSVPPEEVPALIEERFGDRGREAFMLTGAQQLVEQGRAEGRVEGQAELLLVQLRVRFGEVAPEVVTRVRSAKPAELERWAARILSATRVSELFGAR
ncbi:MAG: Rpn family recombination-promoting nuclease/putative transposase [Polyangiaceae bacterium]